MFFSVIQAAFVNITQYQFRQIDLYFRNQYVFAI